MLTAMPNLKADRHVAALLAMTNLKPARRVAALLAMTILRHCEPFCHGKTT